MLKKIYQNIFNYDNKEECKRDDIKVIIDFMIVLFYDYIFC